MDVFDFRKERKEEKKEISVLQEEVEYICGGSESRGCVMFLGSENRVL